MPAIITHRLFGEEAAALLPEGIIDSQEALVAFLLGNQGTDPFWARFSTLPNRARTCHALAGIVHEQKVVETLLALRDSVLRLPEDDRPIGKAFALGMAGHYLLDSTTHPLIYALQGKLAVFEPSLQHALPEVHALIESDIDSWMLWQMRQKTILEAPCSDALNLTPRIGRIAGAMVAQAAWEVFGIPLDTREYCGAVHDYQTMYDLIDPPAVLTARTLTTLEGKFRSHSRLGAQSHSVVCGDERIIANLEHDLWRNPETKEASTASFPDLFHEALFAWPMFSRRLAEGDKRRLAAMVDDINYNGRKQPVA